MCVGRLRSPLRMSIRGFSMALNQRCFPAKCFVTRSCPEFPGWSLSSCVARKSLVARSETLRSVSVDSRASLHDVPVAARSTARIETPSTSWAPSLIRREQQQMAFVWAETDHVVAKIEAGGAHRLRLGEGGSIECVGGVPSDGRLVLALQHCADQVRAILIERARVAVLVVGTDRQRQADQLLSLHALARGTGLRPRR